LQDNLSVPSSSVKQSKKASIAWPLKMGPIAFPKT